MIAVNIPNTIPDLHFTKLLQNLVETGVQSIEVDVAKVEDTLVVYLKAHCEMLDSEGRQCVPLRDLFKYIKKEGMTIQIILNLVEPNLESLVSTLVMEWELRKQVKYAGRIRPTTLSPWDRLNIFYNVENCLPTFYQFESIKKTHFDVIHYFLNKYKVKIFRIQKNGLTDEIIVWAREMNIALSVYGVETVEEAEMYQERGVEYVSTTQIEHFLGMATK